MSALSLQQRWMSVVDRVAKAARSCGRDPGEVLIIGVTKYVDSDATRSLVEAGCRDLAESRPQGLWDKAAALSDQPVRWHMIGHLQRNKVRRSLPLLHCIHSVDSLRLAEQIEKDAAEQNRIVSLLLEANVTNDSNKTGMKPDELKRVSESVLQMPHLRLLGLMGMAGLKNVDPRTDFAAIRSLRDQLQTAVGDAARLDQLSMGMSNDFEAAIEEGATMIRVGSLLFPSEP